MSMTLTKYKIKDKVRLAVGDIRPTQPGEKEYADGRTKQSFKDSCDVNKIIKKAQVEGGLSHALKYDKAVYGEFSGVDLLGAYEQIGRAKAIFADLPSEVRNEFNNDAFAFARFASDPANIDRLPQLIPAIAKPGAFFPNPRQRGGQGAGAATAPQGGPQDPPQATVGSDTDSLPAIEGGVAAPNTGGTPPPDASSTT